MKTIKCKGCPTLMPATDAPEGTFYLPYCDKCRATGKHLEDQRALATLPRMATCPVCGYRKELVMGGTCLLWCPMCVDRTQPAAPKPKPDVDALVGAIFAHPYGDTNLGSILCAEIEGPTLRTLLTDCITTYFKDPA